MAEAPAAIRAMPEANIDEKIAKAKAVLKWLMANHRTAYSTSFGKDSSATLGLAMAAAAELSREGVTIQPFVVMTANTKCENPQIDALARSEMAKVDAWIERFNLPGSTHVAQPNLLSEFAVAVFGGRALPSVAGSKRDCTSDWKVGPLSRLRKQLLGTNVLAAGKFVCSVTGVRRSESSARAANLTKRAESADQVVLTNADGNVAIAPIIEWSWDDVFTYLGMASNGILETYSDFADVITTYREAMGECVINGSDDDVKASKPCSARFGCWTCLQVKDDRSMDQMVMEEHNAYMRPLARLRTFLANTFYDLSRRTWVGRSIDENGYIRFGVDGYSPAMLKELLCYALTIDIEEREAAERLGIAPRFQIVSVEALFSICAMWSLQGFSLPFSALRIYRDIVRGARYPVPETQVFPKVPIPPARYIHVGTDWNQGDNWQYTGLRDALIDAFGGEGCIGHREISTKGQLLTVMDVNTSDMFSVDVESAALLLHFEMDRLVDEWHGPNSKRLTLMEGHHVAGVGYRFYVTYGTISVAKGQLGKIDEILRRTAFRERFGLAGYHYNHEHALSLSVESPVPILPSQEELLAAHHAEVAARREFKRHQLMQKRLNIVDLYRDWAPDVAWRRLVQTGALKMVAIPRGRRGRMVLRHLLTPYRLLAFLADNPLVLQRVRCHRQKTAGAQAVFTLAA
jgi:3'-phosphoadenosine 5'-phosphosulfate sulfotransferase (PAPS reductase)/FAD synthetase